MATTVVNNTPTPPLVPTEGIASSLIGNHGFLTALSSIYYSSMGTLASSFYMVISTTWLIFCSAANACTSALGTVVYKVWTTICACTVSLSSIIHSWMNSLLWKLGYGYYGPLPGTFAARLHLLISKIQGFLSTFSSLANFKAGINTLINRFLWSLGFGPLGPLPMTFAAEWHAFRGLPGRVQLLLVLGTLVIVLVVYWILAMVRPLVRELFNAVYEGLVSLHRQRTTRRDRTQADATVARGVAPRIRAIWNDLPGFEIVPRDGAYVKVEEDEDDVDEVDE